MSKEDSEFRRSQREAFEAVLKALSVVKLDWVLRDHVLLAAADTLCCADEAEAPRRAAKAPEHFAEHIRGEQPCRPSRNHGTRPGAQELLDKVVNDAEVKSSR